MPYKVINGFVDLEADKTRYEVGDEYPKGDYKPTQERIKKLSEAHPKYKRIFIEAVETEDEKTAQEARESKNEKKAKADKRNKG